MITEPRSNAFILCLALAAAACQTTASSTGGGGADAPTGSGSGSPDAGTGGGGGNPDAGGTASGWRAIALPDDQASARVTGISCSSRDACVIATDNTTDLVGDSDGLVLAASDHAVGPVLVDGKDVAEPAHVLGQMNFVGLEKTRDGLNARVDASGARVFAQGDPTVKANWSIVVMGTSDAERLPGNAQEALQSDANGNWLFINRDGFVYGATSAPAPATVWTKLWSPTAEPPAPGDFLDLLDADPTLCESSVSTRTAPTASQNVFVSQDLKLAVLPAGGLNEVGSAAPGVCISTDGGKRFHQRPLDGLPADASSPGPLAVFCLDDDHCFAYNGVSEEGTGYVYFTDDASMGKDSTWTRATMPAAFTPTDDVEPRFMFFAPDKRHGWLAGAKDTHAMLLRTTDGGHSWADVSGAVLAVSAERLHSGFALDADHIWVGGENGTLLFNDSASR